MNSYVILQVLIGAAVVVARPVDVNNDDRPLVNYIAPHQIDDLVITTTVFNIHCCVIILCVFCVRFLANYWKRTNGCLGSGRYPIERSFNLRSISTEIRPILQSRCKPLIVAIIWFEIIAFYLNFLFSNVTMIRSWIINRFMSMMFICI